MHVREKHYEVCKYAHNTHTRAYNIAHTYIYALTRCSHIHDECTDALVLSCLISSGEQ